MSSRKLVPGNIQTLFMIIRFWNNINNQEKAHYLWKICYTNLENSNQEQLCIEIRMNTKCQYLDLSRSNRLKSLSHPRNSLKCQSCTSAAQVNFHIMSFFSYCILPRIFIHGMAAPKDNKH